MGRARCPARQARLCVLRPCRADPSPTSLYEHRILLQELREGTAFFYEYVALHESGHARFQLKILNL